MQNTQKRCAIVSFPKSGNTWFREIVRAIYCATEPIKSIVPDIYRDGITGLPQVSADGVTWFYYKTHAAVETVNYHDTPVHNDLIVYIIRNPLDVFCSQLNYLYYLRQGLDVNQRDGISIHSESMEDAVTNGRIGVYLSEFAARGTLMPDFIDTQSWMENVRYWTTLAQKDKRVIVIKYEDMANDLGAALAPFLARIGMSSVDIEQVHAVADSQTTDGGKFFWRRSDGSFLKYLTRPQIERYLEVYRKLIYEIGYDGYFKAKLQFIGS